MNEDLSVFFDTAEHAVTGTYAGTATVDGIYNAPYAAGADIAGSSPEFLCAAADVDAAPEGNSLVIPAGTFTIVDAKPVDDGSVVVLILAKAS